MVEFTRPCDKFRQQIRNTLNNQTFGWHNATYAKSRYIYTLGQRDGMIYYIVSGQVKLLLTSNDGKQCLASIRTAGDIFGEPCLSGQTMRLETAVAMKESHLKVIPARDFIANMKSNSMLEYLIQYLAVKVSEQLEIIGALTTADGEHRLVRTLLHLGGLLGTDDSDSVLIREKISHEELSSMVGTTRPRIGILLKKFRQLGLVSVTPKGFLVIDQKKMRQFLMQDLKGRDSQGTESGASQQGYQESVPYFVS